MKRMKRWISLVLALSLMLSVCPVSVFAETEETEAAASETVAVTEAVTEPVETTETTEPEQTTVAAEPPEATVTTEPAEETEAVTEPSTQPPETEEPSEPAETMAARQSAQITVSQEASLAEAAVASGSCGTNLTWTFEEATGVLRISGTGAMSDYTSSSIPWYDYVYSIKSVVMEAGVTSIGRSAFSWCTDLTSVTIPAGVTSIGHSAFSYCINLRSVVIPEGVTTIGDYAFSNNPNLTDVTIPEGVTSIGIYAFYECNELTSVTIPASVTRIGEAAFYRCDSLTGIWVSPDNKTYSSDQSGVLFNKDQTKLIRAPGAISGAYTCPETVVSISNDAFHNCTRLSSVTIQNRVTGIGNNAFSVCAGLTSVSIGDSVRSIGESAFNGTALTSVTIPASVEHIGVCAFYNCSVLTGIWVEESNAYYCNDTRGVLLDKAQKTLIEAPGAISGEYTCPASVTSIGSYAFGNCPNLKNVVLPEHVSIIDGWAFHECTGLTAVTIPAGVTSLSVMSFNGCTNLGVIRFCGAAPTFSGNTFSRVTATAYYPAGNTTWTESVMQDYEGTITWIPYEAQADNPTGGDCGDNLTWELTGGVLTVSGTGDMDDFADGSSMPWYDHLSSITSVVLEDGVTEIGSYAFDGCTALVSVTIPASVRYIDFRAFAGCTALKSVTMQEGLKSIGSAAFEDCTALTSIQIPDSVTSIDNYAFYNCSSLISVTLPEGMTRIGQCAFGHCSSLAEVTIPDSLTEIEEFVFTDCISLTSVTIPEKVTLVDEQAFSGCTGLTEITFLGDAPTFGTYVFSRVTATVCYPANNATWTSDIMKDYGGTITWEPFGVCEDGHTEVIDEAVAATCTESGLTEGSHCSVCGVILAAQEVIKPAGHQYEAVYTEPTFDADGFTTYTCSACGDAYTETDEGTMKSAAASIGSVKYETLAEAFAAATEGDTILMLKTYTIAKGTAETWDLSGKTLEVSGNRGGIRVEGNLTVLGGTFRFLEGAQGLMVWENGQVTIEDGTFHTVDSRGIWAVYGKITFNGGTFYVTGNGYIGTSERRVGSNEFAQFVINDGTFYFRDSGHFSDYGNSTIKGGTFYLESRGGTIRADYNYHRDSLTITGGTFYISGAVGLWVDTAKGHLIIRGGTFITTADGAQILEYDGGTLGIYGGTFSQDMTPYLSSNYCCRKSGVYYVVGSHLYNLKNTSEAYLKTEAGCTNPAEYYKSCACGKAGTDTFTHGDPLGHSFTNYVSNDNATCTENGTETASCNRACGTTDEREIPNSAKGHSYQDGRCTVCGDENRCGENLFWKFDADTGTLTISGTGDMAAYTDGGAPWYAYKDSITALNLEEGITSIGDYAFAGCSKVTTVVLPDSVIAVHRCAFANMSGLTSMTFGKNFRQLGSSGDSALADSPFYQCTSLTEITFTGATLPVKHGYALFTVLNAQVTKYVPAEYFGAYAAFLEWEIQGGKVTSKDAPEEFQIRDGVLEAYFGDDAEVTIPDTVTTIGYGAFNNNLNLTKVNLHDGITKIEDYVFCGCTNLSGIGWSENLSRIGGWSFLDCTGLKALVLPDSVTEIGDYAFGGCSELIDMTFGNRLESIGYCAFLSCTALGSSIVIPDSVTFIDTSAFSSCSNLTDIIFEGNAPGIKSSAFRGVKATAHYPVNNATWTENKLQNYGGTLTWKPYCSAENSVSLDAADLSGETSVWIDGVEYPVQTAGDLCYVELPDGNAKTMVSYTYHMEDSSDPHSRYPVGMKVWTLTNENGKYTPVRQADFDDILQYSGMSIRVTGKQGIRMITSVDVTKKNSLISENLAGYTLKEYGTAVAWADQVADQPLVLGKSYVISAYAYRKGIADPVFAYDGNRMQYTNVLVGFREDQCRDDLAMRPYMILADAAGNEITLYGGIVHRSIGYIAYQNRNTFASGTEAYQYVWDIIHNVYGDLYDEEYAA